MKRNCGVLAAALTAWALVVPPAGAGTAPLAAGKANFGITAAQVRSALQQSDVRLAAGRIDLLADVRAGREEAPLQVAEVTRWAEGSLKVRIRCVSRGDCLPFYVLVRGLTPAEAEETLADFQSSATLARPKSVMGECRLRSGDPATLQISGKNVRITLPVICLQKGCQGQEIRVTSLDRKHIYKARVAGSGLLTVEI